MVPTYTLCSGAKPRTFKTSKSLRSHHNKYHPDANRLPSFTVPFTNPVAAADSLPQGPDLVARSIIHDLEVISTCDQEPLIEGTNPKLHLVTLAGLEVPLREEMGVEGLQVTGRGTAPVPVGQDHELLVNPVMRNPLMQLTIEDFKACRIAPTGLISVIDAIKLFKECSKETASAIFNRISQINIDVDMGIPVEFHQFSTRGGPKTPISNCNVLLRILVLIPGQQGDALRKAQAEIAARSISGDHDLEAALPMRRQEMGSEGQALGMTGMSSSNAADLSVVKEEMAALGQDLSVEQERDDRVACALVSANPVLGNPLMQLTVADFQNCRITPTGLHRLNQDIQVLLTRDSRKNI